MAVSGGVDAWMLEPYLINHHILHCCGVIGISIGCIVLGYSTSYYQGSWFKNTNDSIEMMVWILVYNLKSIFEQVELVLKML